MSNFLLGAFGIGTTEVNETSSRFHGAYIQGEGDRQTNTLAVLRALKKKPSKNAECRGE